MHDDLNPINEDAAESETPKMLFLDNRGHPSFSVKKGRDEVMPPLFTNHEKEPFLIHSEQKTGKVNQDLN